MPLHNGLMHNGVPSAFSALSGSISIDQMGDTLYAPGQILVVIKNVNFNSANTDNAITVQLPAGFTRFSHIATRIVRASGSLTTATCGLFTATGAGGTALVASGSTITVSTASEGTANNSQALPATVSSGTTFRIADVPAVYFRVQTAQGVAATADVVWIYAPLP